MPKSLFYGGVVACALVAVLLLAHAAGELRGTTALQPFARGPLYGTNSLAPIYLMILAVPVAGIFLRMASLLAARSLFAGLMGMFAVASSGFAAVYLASVQFRMALLFRGSASAARQEFADVLRPLVDQQLTGYLAMGWFLCLTFLAMRPYFRIHANPLLSAVACLPLPLYFATLGEEMGVFNGIAASIGFWLLLAILFVAVAVHGLLHRHLFIEVTSLRELLDPRVDPSTRNALRLGEGMVFDS